MEKNFEKKSKIERYNHLGSTLNMTSKIAVRFDKDKDDKYIDQFTFNNEDFTVKDPETFKVKARNSNVILSQIRYKNGPCTIRFPLVTSKLIVTEVSNNKNSYSIAYNLDNSTEELIEFKENILKIQDCLIEKTLLACKNNQTKAQFMVLLNKIERPDEIKPIFDHPVKNNNKQMGENMVCWVSIINPTENDPTEIKYFWGDEVSFETFIRGITIVGDKKISKTYEFVPIIELKSIFFGPHGNTGYKASIQVKLRCLFQNQTSGGYSAANALGSRFIEKKKEEIEEPNEVQENEISDVTSEFSETCSLIKVEKLHTFK